MCAPSFDELGRLLASRATSGKRPFVMRFPNCSFDLLDATAAYSLILHASVSRRSFSFIRLGDGEGVLLSLAEDSPERDLQYLRQHIGPAAEDCEVRLRLKQRALRSIQSADLVGVRDDIVGVTFDKRTFSVEEQEFLVSFRANFKLRPPERQLAFAGARRIALLHRELSGLDFDGTHNFCSAWMHYRMHCSGLLFSLLKQHDRIGIISCRAEAPALLTEILGLQVAYHPIPDMYRKLSTRIGHAEYLDSLESILYKQLVEFPGMIFLVGGGLFGKTYCQLIKSQGGIALDVGSLLDAWVGIASRPTVYAAEHRDTPRHNGVPVTLLLNKANVERRSPLESAEAS